MDDLIDPDDPSLPRDLAAMMKRNPVHLPAICDRCGFSRPALVAFGAQFTKVEVGGYQTRGSCPRCFRGQLLLPEGEFDVHGHLIEVVNGAENAVEALRELGLLFTTAATAATSPEELATQVERLSPGFAKWLAMIPYRKEAVSALYITIGLAIVEVMKLLAHTGEPSSITTINSNVTVVERLERQSKYSTVERKRVLDETIRELKRIR